MQRHHVPGTFFVSTHSHDRTSVSPGTAGSQPTSKLHPLFAQLCSFWTWFTIHALLTAAPAPTDLDAAHLHSGATSTVSIFAHPRHATSSFRHLTDTSKSDCPRYSNFFHFAISITSTTQQYGSITKAKSNY